MNARERFIVGVLAVAGVPYGIAASIYGISKAYYYELGGKSRILLDWLFAQKENAKACVWITQNFIERCVMALSFYCRAPIEGIVSFFDLVLGFHISKGKIHAIRERARQKAEEFDATVGLATIKSVATDEIFQQDQAILTTVDLETRYIVLMNPAGNRTGETWSSALKEKAVQGFHPEVNISDGGTGLWKGVPNAFPGIEMQLDIFHALRDLGMEVNKRERSALAKLTRLYELEGRLQGKRKHKKTIAAYEELNQSIGPCLRKVDTLNILYEWLREHMGFTGYSYTRSTEICNWILDEMLAIYPENKKLSDAINAFRRHLPVLLRFQLRLEKELGLKAQAIGVDKTAFLLLYRQMTYPSNSAKYEFAEKKLFHIFGRQLPDPRMILQEVINKTYRASSMIENVNGCIRDFIDLKREIPQKCFVLLKVFFNTKKAKRSRHKTWIGTSALDRLTGQQNPEFLDIVVAPRLAV